MSGYGVQENGAWRSLDGPYPKTEDNPDGLRPDEIYMTTKPPMPIAPPPTADELAAVAKEQRDKLLAVAASRMGPLQDAVDIERATADEAARLVLWKGYRIDLNRIETQDGFPLDIEWPVSPDDNNLQGAAQ